jgi:hypothetical protein
MAAGAVTFVLSFSAFGDVRKAVVDWGKVILPDATHVAPVVYIIALAVASAATYVASRVWRTRETH